MKLPRHKHYKLIDYNLDLPFFELPAKKREFFEARAQFIRRLLPKHIRERLLFNMNYRVRPSGVFVITRAVVFAGFVLSLFIVPPAHNYMIARGHEKRLERHEQYLKENPRYKEALLTAYGKLAPPQKI